MHEFFCADGAQRRSREVNGLSAAVFLGAAIGLVVAGLGVLLVAVFSPGKARNPNRAKLVGIVCLVLGVIIFLALFKS